MTMEVITVRNGEIIRGKLFGDHMKAYRFCVQRNFSGAGAEQENHKPSLSGGAKNVERADTYESDPGAMY